MTRNFYVNRELSWLKFNERVLEEATDQQVPLCERLSFISIFQSNLDEFFMVRVGALLDEMLYKRELRDNKTNLTSEEQISLILKKCKKLGRQRDAAYQEIMGLLEEKNFKLCLYQELTTDGMQEVEHYFIHEVMPLLTPMIVGRKQPFPFLKQREIYAVVVIETSKGKEKIGIVPCNSLMTKRLIPISSMPGCHILLEELILHFVSRIFVRYTLAGKSLVMITRSADIDADAMEEEDLDYREKMAEIIKMRQKLAPIRLEMTRELDPRVVKALCLHLKIQPEQVFLCNTPLDLSFAGNIRDLLREDEHLFFPKFSPAWPKRIQKEVNVLQQAAKKDILLSYPYESIRPFITMLHEAANCEDVASIKMTLYRLAKQSQIVDALVEAAENGKEVVVLVELQARFDEENNIAWSRRLESAGCTVIYGIDSLKVHSKLCLITKKTATGVEYITQIGTGNYNEKTATLYTDLSLITADPEIGQDAAKVFNCLCMGEIVHDTQHLLVAPAGLQNRLIDLIDREIGKSKENREAYIGIKINSLTDRVLIDKLVEASQSGVRVDMVVRGICCLLPGIEGVTENIHIRSIVGRFLEHPRIFIFGRGEDEKIYISSADLMTRNTLRRVEVAAPIYNEELRAEIRTMFSQMLKDNIKARQMQPDGTYIRAERSEENPLNSQEFFIKYFS